MSRLLSSGFWFQSVPGHTKILTFLQYYFFYKWKWFILLKLSESLSNPFLEFTSCYQDTPNSPIQKSLSTSRLERKIIQQGTSSLFGKYLRVNNYLSQSYDAWAGAKNYARFLSATNKHSIQMCLYKIEREHKFSKSNNITAYIFMYSRATIFIFSI